MARDGWGWRLRRPVHDPAPPSVSDDTCEDCQPEAPVRQFAVTGILPPTVVDSDVPRRRPGLVETVLDDQMVLLDVETPVPHVLNTGAAFVWQALDGRRTVAEIIAELSGPTGLDPRTLGAQVRNAVAELRQAGFVAIDDPDAPSAGPTPAPRLLAPLARRLLDEVDWVDTIGPRSMAATTVAVRTNTPETGVEVRRLLEALPSAPGPAATTLSLLDRGEGHGRRFTLYVEDRREWWQPSPTGLGDRVLSQLNLVAAEEREGHVVLHAGAVEQDGQVVVITGHSGRGKSTLTAALTRRGFGYLTDEAAAIGVADLSVAPYPKPIALDHVAVELLGLAPGEAAGAAHKTLVAPGRLGRVSAGGRMGLLVLLDEPADDPHTAPMSLLLRVLRTVFPATLRDPHALDALATIIDEVPTLHLPRVSPDEACDRIESALRDAE